MQPGVVTRCDVALTPDQVELLARRLQERLCAFRTLPADTILSHLAEAHARWAADVSPWRCQASKLVAAATGYPEPVVDQSLQGLFASMNRIAMERWLAAGGITSAMLDGAATENGIIAFGPRLTLVVSSGNVPGAALPSVAQALLLKAPVLVKSAAAEPVLMPLYAASLTEAAPEVASALAVASWRGGDHAVEDALLPYVDAVIAYGGDDALTDLRSRLPVRSRFIGYGHRVSFSAIGRERLKRGELPTLARAAALDVCIYDQQGCLSPQAIYVEEGGEVTPAVFAEALAQALEALRTQIARRPLDPAEASAIHQFRTRTEMRAFSAGGPQIWMGEGSSWTVVLETDPSPGSNPLNRTAVVTPIGDLNDLPGSLAPLSGALISAAVAVGANRAAQLMAGLGAAGVTRVCPLGAAQMPEDALHHDGVNAIATLSRFVRLQR